MDFNLCPRQAAQLLFEGLALVLDIRMFLQIFVATFDKVRLTEFETLPECECKVLTHTADKFCVNDEWDVVNKSVECNCRKYAHTIRLYNIAIPKRRCPHLRSLHLL